jgi:hypothetical protein
LPIYPEMTKEMIGQVAECIGSFFKETDRTPVNVVQFAELH